MSEVLAWHCKWSGRLGMLIASRYAAHKSVQAPTILGAWKLGYRAQIAQGLGRGWPGGGERGVAQPG